MIVEEKERRRCVKKNDTSPLHIHKICVFKKMDMFNTKIIPSFDKSNLAIMETERSHITRKKSFGVGNHFVDVNKMVEMGLGAW
jgi:hypothetical protein